MNIEQVALPAGGAWPYRIWRQRMTNDELEAIRARAGEIVIARRETHERDKAVMFQAAADRRNLIAAYDALETNALRELADAQTAYVARGVELRDAEARLAEEVKNKKEFERDWLAACDELCNTRSQLANIEAQNRVMWDVASDREARLAEAEALLREAEVKLANPLPRTDFARNLLRRIRAFLAADSATHRENDSHD